MSRAEADPPPLQPVSLSKSDDRCLLVEWQDGLQQVIPFRLIRQNCRCAHCLEEGRDKAPETSDGQPKLSLALPILTAAETMPLDILTMQPAGNYAYRIHFSDGHSSGIYPFELLRWIGDQASARPEK